MNDYINEKLQYDTPTAQIVIFPLQDVLTTSSNGPIILPDDEW